MAIMSFLTGLPYKFKTVKSYILFGYEITTPHEVSSRVLRAENTAPNQQTNVLVAKGGGRNNNSGG